MPDSLQTKVVVVLAVSTMAMLVLVLATPFVFFDERPGLPIYPSMTVDYLEDDGAFIILITSVSGHHIYTGIILSINGVVETINYTYTLERHTYAETVNITVEMMDENENLYSMNATFSRVDGADPAEFTVHIEDPDQSVDDTLVLDDFPYTRRLQKVVE